MAISGAVIALLALGVVLIRSRRRRRRQVVEGEAGALPAAVDLPTDADWWWAEISRRLAAGEWRGAVEALWWWTARRLDPPGLDASWTTDDLLRASRSAALRAPLRKVDRMLWSGGEPAREEIAGAVTELRQRVAELRRPLAPQRGSAGSP